MPKEHPFVLGGMAPAAQGADPEVPISSFWLGHILAQTLQEYVVVPGVIVRHREDGKQGGGIGVIHHRLFISMAIISKSWKGSAEVKFHPAPAATATHMGTAQAPWEQTCHHCPHPQLQVHSQVLSPWCWNGHRQSRVSLNPAGILPMTSAQWRLLIVLFAEIIWSSPWQPCTGGMPDFFPN